MRRFTKLFQIEGQPMLAPDAEVAVKYSDVEGADSGTDEVGAMHRFVTRHNVASWSFEYGQLTEEEKRYMERLFPETAEFSFTRPDRVYADRMVTVRAYRSGYSLAWRNAVTGLWNNYRFDIVEC